MRRKEREREKKSRRGCKDKDDDDQFYVDGVVVAGAVDVGGCGVYKEVVAEGVKLVLCVEYVCVYGEQL